MAAKKHQTSLFLFHRDLRLNDNTGLIEALKNSKEVIAAFILDEQQVTEKNRYRSVSALGFMKQSLMELNKALESQGGQLALFYGQSIEVLESLIQTEHLHAIYSNRDYTPFARKRDESIKQLCQKHGVDFLIYDDALLTRPEAVHKADGTPYTIFTPFFRKASELKINPPQQNSFKNYSSKKLKGASQSHLENIQTNGCPNPYLKGGRQEGLSLLKKIGELKTYSGTRNIPALDQGTSLLSAHHKFGTISIRETYFCSLDALGPDTNLIQELYWRDFFTHIAFHFPHVFKGAFHQKYNAISWQNDRSKFDLWCAGKTGFPIVDAGMRQLNQTGYMHNRVRMIVASFLVKDLHISWQWGEQYFAHQLIDYDPAVNNGNWQWAASTGCDAQPYFRIFNPELQHKRFDPDASYTKKWVPELTQLDAKTILKLYHPSSHPPNGYPQKIADHKEASTWIKEVFQAV